MNSLRLDIWTLNFRKTRFFFFLEGLTPPELLRYHTLCCHTIGFWGRRVFCEPHKHITIETMWCSIVDMKRVGLICCWVNGELHQMLYRRTLLVNSQDQIVLFGNYRYSSRGNTIIHRLLWRIRIHAKKKEHIQLANGFLKESLTSIAMLYKNIKKTIVHSLDRDTDFFDIVAGVSYGEIFAQIFAYSLPSPTFFQSQ